MMLQRLFAAAGPRFADHRAEFGELPTMARRDLIRWLDEAGLTGRGGAGFPTGRKIDSVSGREPVVIGNGAEGEPLSEKDITLLTRAPHLVLDGLTVTADALRAKSVYLYVPARASAGLQAALAEREGSARSRCRITVAEAPADFLAGEESAVVNRIGGGLAVPRDKTTLITRSGLRGRPTLVSNVETFAHIALIARFGADWFRAVGDSARPGTMLVTVSGAGIPATVVEIPTGTALRDIVAHSEVAVAQQIRAVLVGGYHGSWVPAGAVGQARLSPDGLAPYGAAPGAGVLHLLGEQECGLAHTADVAAYLADQSARQCGPCRYGLPRLSTLLDQLAFGHVDNHLISEIHRMVGLVDGRGACRHPDGTARFVRSALAVFESDITDHRNGFCQASRVSAVGEMR